MAGLTAFLHWVATWVSTDGTAFSRLSYKSKEMLWAHKWKSGLWLTFR